MTFLRLVLIMASLVAMANAYGYNNCKRYATYNTGLTPSVPDYNTRREPVRQALRRYRWLGAETLCLQEVWFEQDMANILSSLQGFYPYHFSKIHASTGVLRDPSQTSSNPAVLDTPCSLTDALRTNDTVGPCAAQQGCLGNTVQSAFCILTRCASQVLTVSASCVSCQILNGQISPDLGREACFTPRAVNNRYNDPGLVLLSKRRPESMTYTRFFDAQRQLIERGYITAKFRDGREVVCTHLSSPAPYIEPELQFGSYEVQSREEVRLLGERFPSRKAVILGDFNFGPELNDPTTPDMDVTSQFPQNYEAMEELGYRSPYLTLTGQCTFCNNTNPLTNGSQDNNIVDHVFVRGGPYIRATAKRLFDKAGTSLSDHYGVEVKVCTPRKRGFFNFFSGWKR